MTRLSKNTYGPSLCLWTNTMPMNSHTHMLTYLYNSFLNSRNYLCQLVITLLYLHLCFCLTLTSPCATFTIPRNSKTPKLHHIPQYINCSYSMYFFSSNIRLLTFQSLHLSLCSITSCLTPCKLRQREVREDAAHKLKPHCLLCPAYNNSGPITLELHIPVTPELHISITPELCIPITPELCFSATPTGLGIIKICWVYSS